MVLPTHANYPRPQLFDCQAIPHSRAKNLVREIKESPALEWCRTGEAIRHRSWPNGLLDY